MSAGYTNCKVCTHIGNMSTCRQGTCPHYVFSSTTGADWEYCLLHRFIQPPATCAATPGCNSCQWDTRGCKACYAVTRGTRECAKDCPYNTGAAPQTGSAAHCSLLSNVRCPHYQINNSCYQCTY